MHKRLLRYAAATLVITFVVVLAVWAAAFSGHIRPAQAWLAKAEYTACDELLFKRRGILPTPDEIVVVGIDAASISVLGNWPFPRSHHAKLVRQLKAMGAKVVAFDVVMDVGRGNEGDAELVVACREAGNVVMAAQVAAAEDAVGGKRQVNLMLPFDELAETCDVGTVNFEYEEDQVVRRAAYGHEVAGFRFPLLSVMATARYRGVDPETLVREETLELGDARFPLDADGSFWINYIGPQGYVRTASYYQALPGPGGEVLLPPDYFRDKLVFVGATDPLLQDTVATPYENPFPGVTVHANIASMLLHNQPIRRVDPIWGLALAALFALGLSAVSVTRRPQWAALWWAVVTGVYAAAAAWLFSAHGIWIPVVLPLLGAFLATIGGGGYGYFVEGRERRRISSLFSKYVSRDVARELMEDEGAAQLGRSRKLPITCLFSDIRGFTTMSERLSAEEVVAVLNEYFDKMVECVFENRGTLDKYMGDAIMATYGVPKSFGDDAERACRTAIRMREELTALQRKWEAAGWTGIDIGIGINSGDAVVGNIGHHERMEFTCIGDTVNTACRLESLNKEVHTHILISQATWDEVKDTGLFEVRRLPPAHVKGKAEAVQIYELMGWAKPGAAQAQTEETAAVS